MKYHNTKVTVDGIRFDSKLEAKRYTELKLLLKAGAISELELQKAYTLQPSFKYSGKTERAITYRADFAYIQDGKEIVEDAKGFKTDVYSIKRKMLLYTHPHIEFREIEK